MLRVEIYTLLITLAFIASFFIGNFVGYERGRKDAQDLQTKLNRGN